MKRKAIAAVLGMVIVMGSASAAMAAEQPADKPADLKASITVSSTENNKDAATKAFPVTITLSAGKDGNVKDGLSIYHMKDVKTDKDGVESGKSIGGTLTRDEFSKVLNAMNLGEEEKTDLMKKFDGNKEIQDQIDEVAKKFETAKESEYDGISEEIDALSKKTIELFSDAIVDKALELGFVQELDFYFSKTSELEMKLIDGEEQTATTKSLPAEKLKEAEVK